MKTKKTNKEIASSMAVIFGPLMVLIAVFVYINFFDANPTKIPPSSQAPVVKNDPFEGIELQARAAYVENLNTGEILYSLNSKKELPIASITKLMTAVTAEEIFEESESVQIEKSHLSLVGDQNLLVGEIFKIEELINLMLVSSSNDSSKAIAMVGGAKIGDRPNANFVRQMNKIAKAIGLNNSHFRQPSGLDLERISEPSATASAEDVSKLAKYILQNNPDLVESTRKNNIVSRSNTSVHNVENTNKIVDELPNILLSKTGYTTIAGGNLVVVIDPGLNTPIAITVLGSTREGRFSDVKKLSDATLELMASSE
jgi:D-alanyl-D-alanine carboxypeptidase